MFVSSSVTCFFAPKIDKPDKSGSLGVSFTIDEGVHVSTIDDNKILFNGKYVKIPTLEYILERFGYDGGVKIETNLPLGCGFGLSGAIALATSLKINEILRLNLPLLKVADIAHEAEVVNRTGLGDVTTQCHGGFVVRYSTSKPSKCKVDRFLWNVEIDFLVMGEIKTDEVIEGNVREIYKIGKNTLKAFLKKPSLENLFRVSKEFSLTTGFADDDIIDAIEAVESEGGLASMIMLGRGVFAYKGSVLRELRGSYFKSNVSLCGIRKNL